MAGSKTILFIEDDKPIAEMYARVLEREGYAVEFAYNGEEGLKKAEAKEYDLILLDIMMPQKTGIEVLQALRGEDGKGSPKTKIVILTNLAQDKTSQEALKAQADGYIIKADIVPSQLAGIVGRLV
ncbi:MAG: Response regulator receiver protein [Candidatus Saccharibacteria bacterium]|jgi:CheY-like chemotaxis protein|nr:Response regulator receiver protein [Candidatus Saccharibacteria bacterium]